MLDETSAMGPAELWQGLDGVTREEAARALYRGEGDSGSGRREADRAVAAAIRFREAAVRGLPVDRRVEYLVKAVHPDDSLASSLLISLHLGERVAMLEAFLDRLGIPQQGGLIDEDYDLQPPDGERLAVAVETIYGGFDVTQVEVYLATLVALDPETWGGLVEVLRGRDSA